MAIQFTGITNTPALQKTQTTAFTANAPALKMGKDTVSFGNAAKVAEEVVTSPPVKSFLGKMIASVGSLLVKCKDMILSGIKATGSGTMTALKALGNVLVWPIKAVAGLFTKAPEAVKEAAEVVAKAAT